MPTASPEMKKLAMQLSQQFTRFGHCPYVTPHGDEYVCVGKRFRVIKSIDSDLPYEVRLRRDGSDLWSPLAVCDIRGCCIAMIEFYHITATWDPHVTFAHTDFLKTFVDDNMMRPGKVRNLLKIIQAREHRDLESRYTSYRRKLNELFKAKGTKDD